MEEIRQSSAQPGSRSPAAAAAGQLAAATRPRRRWPPVGTHDHHPASLVVGGRRTFPEAAGSVAGVAPARAGRLVGTPVRPSPAQLRVPAVRRLYQPRCHRPDAGAAAVYSQTTPGMANRQRRRTHRPQRSRGILCDHVDRTGRHSGLWVFPGLDAALSVIVARAYPGPMVGLSLDSLAHQPAHRAFGGAGVKTAAISLPSAHGAQDLAFLRNLRHGTRTLAAAG